MTNPPEKRPKFADEKRIGPRSKNKLFLLGIFFLGVEVGFLLHGMGVFKERREDYFRLVRLYPEGDHLVNPLMQVEGPPGGDAKLESAKKSLESYINRCIKNGEVSTVSVYLKDLNKATWIGINEDERFTIASLAKVPILFTFLLRAQKDPSILNKEIKYETEIKSPVHQNIAPRNNLELGKSYSVDELLRHMIVYSDNTPMFLLADDVDTNLVAQLFRDLRLSVPRPHSDYEISAKDYARYFRLLYSATYLNKDSSEKALTLLTQTDFDEGIVAGVPKGITVADKFGERVDPVGGDQLHDCGIVYYPKSPYLICVMTKGWNLDTLKGVIQNISRIAYEHKNS